MSEQKRYTIKAEFLELGKYETAAEECRKYDSLFHKWNTEITQSYRGTGHPSVVGKLLGPSEEGVIEILCEGFTSFINSQIDIVNEHLASQEDDNSNTNVNMMSTWNDRIQEMVSRLKKKNIQQSTINPQLRRLERQITLQSPTSIENYGTNKWEENLAAIKEYLALSEKKQKIAENDLESSGLDEELQENLVRYRKKLLDFKYGCLKKGVKSSRRFLECLGEYFSIGLVILRKLNTKLRGEISQINRTSRVSRDSTIMKTEVTHGYVRGSKHYLDCLKNLREFFTCELPKNSQQLSAQLMNTYSGNQTFVSQMTDTLHFFRLWAEQKQNFVRQIDEILHSIHSQNKQIRKSIDLYLTLSKVRSNQTFGEEMMDNSFMERELAMDKIQNLMLRLVESLLKSYSDMGQKCLKIRNKAIEPKNNAQNFEVSYEYKTIKIKNRKPSRQVIWLWRDWRNFDSENQGVSAKVLERQKLQERQNFIEDILGKSGEGYKYSCSISLVKQFRVKLKIYENKIQIKSKRGSSQIDLTIPLSEIEQFSQKNRGIILRLKSQSTLVLYKFSDVDEVKDKLSEVLNDNNPQDNAKAGQKVVKKKKPDLTDQERKAIQARRGDVEKQREDMNGYVVYGQKSFKGVSIQDIFDYIFSDAGTCPLNNGSFQAHIANKFKNKNYSQTKYDSIGPGYYTGNPDVNFTNCPIFSTRNSQLDHPLPKIPFLPKECHCTETDKIVWVSDKQLDYSATVITSGTSMMQAFLTKTLYKVKESDGETLVQIYAKVVFVKSSAFKSALEAGAIGQFKQLIPGVIKEVQRCVKAGKVQAVEGGEIETNGAAGKGDVQDEDSVVGQSPSKDSNNNTIKLVMGIIIGSLLLNFLLFRFVG